MKLTFITLALASSLLACNDPPADAADDSNSKSGSKGDKEKEKPKAPPPKTPEGVKITFDAGTSGASRKVTLDKTDITGELSCFSMECGLRLEKAPEDLTASIGGKEAKADKISLRLEFDVSEAVGNAAPKDALTYDKTIDTKLTLDITFPDGVKVSAPLPPLNVNYAVDEDFKKKLINGTPVLFGKEDPAPPKQHSIWYVGKMVDDGLFGPAKVMKEIDLVVVEERLPERDGKKKCSGYKATGETGPGRDADLWLVDYDVKIIERKTGKVVETKKFEADMDCPYVASNNKATSYPDTTAIAAWVRTKR
jgi:hypothetical protein